MDFVPILTWWFIIFIIGLVGWPLAFSLLRHVPDRGYSLARPVGFLVSGYILWLGASFRLLQNNPGGIVIALVSTLVLGLFWQRQQVRNRQSPALLVWLRQNWRYIVVSETIFALAFLSWAIFKAYNPNIETAGGEKWMEIAFINGILRSDYFPPQDPWLAGYAISYYYFGYVLLAYATQLANLMSVVAFNLYVPTLFAMTLTAAFGLGSNMARQYQQEVTTPLAIGPTVTGLVAALFVAILGNQIGLFEVLHKRGLLPTKFWEWLDIRDLNVPPLDASIGWIPDRFIWWWRGSRVLTDYNLAGHEQEVIDEFPFFSFLLADVHPHVMALPFVLLVVSLALNLLLSPDDPLPNRERQENRPIIDKLREILENSWHDICQVCGGRLAFVFYACCIGGLSFLNTWDFPIYLSVVGLTFLMWQLPRRAGWNVALIYTAGGMAILAVTGIVLYLPFYATFQSQARGILPNLWNPSRLPQLFVFFGPFFVAVAVQLGVLARLDNNSGSGSWKKQIRWTVPLTIVGPVLLMLISLGGILLNPAGRGYLEGIINNPEVQAATGVASINTLVQESLRRRLTNPWTFLFLGGLLGWALALLVSLGQTIQPDNRANSTTLSQQPIEKFALILSLVGLGLPLAVEFIYLRDNFGIRMNTIFKFYFQAWVLLALVSAFAMCFVTHHLKGIFRRVWLVGMVILILTGMIYPALAVLDKTDYFENEPTLNGIAWIEHNRPADYAGIKWLQTNAPDNAVILEAPGSGYAAYQYTGRVSAMTGLPTLLGWGGHQSQWRGNYDEPARREPDIDLLFNTSDLAQAQTLLNKYNIRYVYIGPLERERYPAQGLSKFSRLMQVAFEQDDVIIYQR